jgi:catechol 2,3-dioxygenase-like lactoylglutathione lyase family enzyme
MEETMLSDHECYATLPTSDPDQLRRFYEDVLGFTPLRENPAGIFYRTAGNTHFAITRSTGKPSGAHTQLGFAVGDLAAEVADLRGRGVTFEEYDLPGFTTTDGIARIGVGQAAWFKDPDGNLIGMIEFDA